MNRKIRSTILAITVVAILVISQTASAATKEYSYVDLGTLGGTFSEAYNVNRFGQVVGCSTTASSEVERPFLWSNGVMTDLGVLPGATSSCAVDINDAGQVVGYGRMPYGGNDFYGAHAFLWQNGVMIDLGSLRPGDHWVTAEAINNLGQVVGYSKPSQDEGEAHAFLWQNGTMTDLGSLGGAGAVAYDINDSGQVVGGSQTSSGESHAFLWQNGTMIDLGTLGGDLSYARAINKHGEVIGYSHDAYDFYTYFLWRKGVMTDLGFQVEVVDINDQGQMVGAEDQGWRTYVLGKHGGTLPGPEGDAFGMAWAINNKGLVVGWADNSSGEIHATLWTR